MRGAQVMVSLQTAAAPGDSDAEVSCPCRVLFTLQVCKPYCWGMCSR